MEFKPIIQKYHFHNCALCAIIILSLILFPTLSLAFQLACPDTCALGQLCACTVNECDSGFLMLKNIEGIPLNLTSMAGKDNFPINFFSENLYTRSFEPSSAGKMSVFAVCLGGETPEGQERKIIVLSARNYSMMVSLESGAANVLVYVVPAITDNKILPDTSISDSYKSNRILITAARGEYEPASFVVKSDKDISSLVVESTDLTGTSVTIPAANVDIKSVKVWWQAGDAINDISHKQLTPELLLKDDSLVKVAGNNNYIKLSDGRELIISDSAGITGISHQPTNDEFPVKDSGDFLPVNLPGNYNKQIWVTVKVPETATGKYSGKIYLKSDGQILKEIDLVVNVLPFKLSDSKIDYSLYCMTFLRDKGTIGGDRDTEQYVADLKNMFEHGINNPLVGDSPATFFKILDFRKQVGMSNEVIFYHHMLASVYSLDELDLTTPENQELIRKAHVAGLKVFDAQYQNKTAVADKLDLLVSFGTLDRNLAKIYHDYGNKIYSYGNPQMGVERPKTYRVNYGLSLWQSDYDGAMDFAYMFGERDNTNTKLSNMWNDFDGLYFRDHNAVYPTTDGVIDTIQWEGFREGVDDVRYLSTLLDTVEDARARGEDVSEAEAWIKNLKASNLSEKNLDEVRKIMAEYIIQLSPPPTCSFTIASGTNDFVEETRSWAVEAYSENSAWNASIPEATWIWSTYKVAHPRTGDNFTFVKNFELAKYPAKAIFSISADNNYDVYLNEALVLSGHEGSNFLSARTVDLTQLLRQGNNTLKIRVENLPAGTDDPEANPAGLIYKLRVCAGLCIPGSVSGCQVCNSDGTSWVDDNSKCASNQTCQNGECIASCAKEGEIFSDANRQCCSGLTRVFAPRTCISNSGSVCTQVVSYTCVNVSAKCTPGNNSCCTDSGCARVSVTCNPGYQYSFGGCNSQCTPKWSCDQVTTQRVEGSSNGCVFCNDGTLCGQKNANGVLCACVDIVGIGINNFCRLQDIGTQEIKSTSTPEELLGNLFRLLGLSN